MSNLKPFGSIWDMATRITSTDVTTDDKAPKAAAEAPVAKERTEKQFRVSDLKTRPMLMQAFQALGSPFELEHTLLGSEIPLRVRFTRIKKGVVVPEHRMELSKLVPCITGMHTKKTPARVLLVRKSASRDAKKFVPVGQLINHSDREIKASAERLLLSAEPVAVLELISPS